MNDNELLPDEIEVSHDPHTGEIKIDFRSDHRLGAAIVLDRVRAATLVAQLTQKIGHGNVTPISAQHLQERQTLQTVSARFQKTDLGALVLVLGLSLGDRIAMLRTSLDEGMVADLKKAIEDQS